jgi:hypothetical protein
MLGIKRRGFSPKNQKYFGKSKFKKGEEIRKVLSMRSPSG